MNSFFQNSVVFLAIACCQVSAVAVPSEEKRATYPFNRLVAFGDELSDNGNGSFAHGITGNPANVYGFGTWTNGPVAVQYLAGSLGVPLVDYAFGGCCGGSSGGATIDNSYTKAAAMFNGQPVPSVSDQILKNYTKPAPASISESLQFIWVGENDLSAHTDAFFLGDVQNTWFANNISERITASAESLIDAGAPNVFVANIYPKHKAPVTTAFLCQDGSCVDTWGQVIQNANTAIKTSLSQSKHASKFIYYDVFDFMLNLMTNKDSFGLTQPLTFYCDGNASDPNEHFQECISGSHVWDGAETFYWMNYIQPTVHVHQLIAADMKNTIDKFFGV